MRFGIRHSALGILLGVGALAIGQGQAPAAPLHPTAASVVSKMFAYYAGAHSMMGTIRMTQAAAGHQMTLDTTLAYSAPNKLLIKHVRNSTDPATWVVTSDGKIFTYDPPNPRRFSTEKALGRYMEAVAPKEDFRDMYRGASLSLGEKDLPEDLAIAGKKELAEIRDTIADLQYDSLQKLNGEDVHVLTGGWRADLNTPPSATFQMFVTDDGQLRRYARREIFAAQTPSGQSIPPQEILTVWDVKLQKDAGVEDGLFTVVR